MAKKKAKRKVSTKTKAKRFASGAKKAVKRVGKKVGRKTGPLGKKVKQGAKRVGKKAKKLAKSDAGRAGIGAGAGALLLGPVGAVAGAAAGLATRNPGRGRKRNVSAFDPGQFDRPKTSRKGESSKVRGLPSPGSKLARAGLRPKDKARLALEQAESAANPEPQVKISSVMGSMLFDYHKASPAIEHVAASAFRSERVPLSIVEQARADLRSLYKIQSQAAEREQIRDLIDSFDVVIRKAGHSMARKNPARAFSLDAQVKSMRRGKAKKAAMGMASQSKVYSEVKGKSLASSLRKINPGASAPSMLDKLTGDYRKARGRWFSVSTKAGSTEGEVARAKKRMDDAEDKLVMYADIKNLSPRDLHKHIESLSDKPRSNPELPRALKRGIAPKVLPLKGKKMWESIFDGSYTYYRKQRGATSEQAEEIAARTAWDEIKRYYKKSGSKWVKRKRALPQVKRPHEVQLGNPLGHIPPGAGLRKIRNVVSHNIAIEMNAGKPQKQAVAIAISAARSDADRIGGATAKLIRAEYPSLNPKSVKKLTKIPKGVKVKRVPPGKAEGAELPGEWMQERKPSRPAPVPKGIGVRAFNPKKTKRKVTPEWQRLNRRCQKLWERYCERPGRARLKDVFIHLEKMDGHSRKSVKQERGRCMKAAKIEAKRLGMKTLPGRKSDPSLKW